MSDIVPALVTGGLGAAVGSIGTALIQSVSARGEARAVAADRVTNAAGNLADRLDKMNSALQDQLARSEAQNTQMRRAMVSLTEAVEDLLPIVPDPGMRRRVEQAIHTARIAFH